MPVYFSFVNTFPKENLGVEKRLLACDNPIPYMRDRSFKGAFLVQSLNIPEQIHRILRAASWDPANGNAMAVPPSG
jgi:hypothetical protein